MVRDRTRSLHPPSIAHNGLRKVFGLLLVDQSVCSRLQPDWPIPSQNLQVIGALGSSKRTKSRVAGSG